MIKKLIIINLFLTIHIISQANELNLVKASFFGSISNDNIEGAAIGIDGSIYLVGNAGTNIEKLPDQTEIIKFGDNIKNPLCGCGFVLKLSSDGTKIISYAEFGKGIIHLTGIAATEHAIYIGGYASDALENLLKESKGFMISYPLRKEQKLIMENKILEANGLPPDKPDPIAGRPWLGRLGAPCVIKLSTDLKKIESGTFLEGSQQVYDKYRRCGKLQGFYQEYFWQPINICPLKSGDIVVSHDGGYFRLLTEEDKAQAKKISESIEEQNDLLKRLAFYDVADYVSCLSPDLSKRKWKTNIYTPPTNPEIANKIKKGWNLPHYSNPRTHRMRIDKNDNIWICGWSASATSQEPWWSPFLFRIRADTGSITLRLYEYDPMSGGGNRMGGTVADTAVLSVSFMENGDLLACLISDGGNTVMGWGPRGNEGKRLLGPVIGPGLGGSPAHFWGHVHRIDAKTFDGLGGVKSGPWAWAIDTAGLSTNYFLVVGRWNAPLPWTQNAWWKDTDCKVPNPNAFLRVVGPDFNTVFWTALPGVRPFEVIPAGKNRYILTGFAISEATFEKDSLMPPSGNEDGYFAIIEWKQ